MDCGQARELIHAMIDSALGGSEEAALGQHLAGCQACRRYRDLFNAMKNRLKSLGAAAVDFTAERPLDRFMRSSLSASALPETGSLRAPRFVYAAAAAVLVAISVFIGIAILAPSASLADSVLREHRLRETGELVLDTHADCCKDLQEWFQVQVKHPVKVPDIKFEDIEVEGGKLYRHPTGNEIFYMACSLDGKPVSIFVCSGPNIVVPEGTPCACGPNAGVMTQGDCYTMITWQVGECTNVLVTCFGAEKTRAIFAAME